MSNLPMIQPVTLRGQIVERIRTAIVQGSLRPNDHIVEQELTEQLGVSRTPVREALILLEGEGLVEFIPNRGCFVRAYHIEEIEEIFSMRTMLENCAAELIIQQLTDSDFATLGSLIDEQAKNLADGAVAQSRVTDMAFHQYFIERTGHKLLAENWLRIVAQIAALIHTRALGLPDYDEAQVISDHRRILVAYRSGDVAQVKEVNTAINNEVAAKCIEAIQRIEEES